MSIDARSFLGLRPTEDPLHWRMPVVAGLTTPGRFLFGGCGLAGGVEVMEAVTGRPCVWATAQYLSFAPLDSVVDFEVRVAVHGHQVSQARAIGRVAGEEILTVNGALGRRSSEHEGEWVERPDVPGPESSPPREVPVAFAGTIMERVEVRVARGRQFGQLDGTIGSGRACMWARMPDVLEPSAAVLAVFGDYVPGGVAEALGRAGGGTSLDNTIRVARLVPTEWVLIDIRMDAVHSGFAHGQAYLWAEDGTLLGTASQSVIVRFFDPTSGLRR
jgi:acyl-CoA thioesterase II